MEVICLRNYIASSLFLFKNEQDSIFSLNPRGWSKLDYQTSPVGISEKGRFESPNKKCSLKVQYLCFSGEW